MLGIHPLSVQKHPKGSPLLPGRSLHVPIPPQFLQFPRRWAENRHSLYAIPLVISRTKVFLAGAAIESDQSHKRTYIWSFDSGMRRLEDMLYAGWPGLIYFNDRNCVMAFGGGSAATPINNIQVFSLKAGKWSVPGQKMLHSRFYFNPCQYHSSVYLISGNVLPIERYCLKTSTCSLIGELSTPLPFQFTLFPYQEHLYILFSTTCLVYDLTEFHCSNPILLPENILYSRFYCIINGQVLLNTSSSSTYKFDLHAFSQRQVDRNKPQKRVNLWDIFYVIFAVGLVYLMKTGDFIDGIRAIVLMTLVCDPRKNSVGLNAVFVIGAVVLVIRK